MKRYLGIIVAIVFVAVAIGYAKSAYSKKAVEADKAENWSRVQREYFERVAWIRSNPDEKSYKDEVGTFFRWYFNQVNEHHNRFGGNKEFDGYLEELDKRAEKGKDSQLAEKKAYFEYTKKIFDQFRNGSYAPVWTASDKGMRLDVVSANVQMVTGKPQVRYQLVLWGPQRELREDGKVKKMVTSASWSVTWKLTDEKEKLMGEMTASGDPSSKIDWPERFITEFPGQMYLGHYDVDLMPAEVKTAEITFAVTSRSASGGEARANFVWKLDAPAEWKLRPGEKWEGAQESVRPEEEIDPKKQAQK